MAEIRLQEYTRKIEHLIQDGRQAEAIAHCRHILHFYPKHVQTYRLLGTACLAEGMYSQAREFFQRALGVDPENLDAWVGLSKVYDEQGMLPEAIWPLERAFELAPSNVVIRRDLQRLYARRGGEHETHLALNRRALGLLYARSGLYKQAIDELGAALHRDPDLPAIQVALAEALWHEGRDSEAAESCIKILQVLPNCLKANLILGTIRLRSGHTDAGRAMLNAAHAVEPECLVAREMLGGGCPLPIEEFFIPELQAEGILSTADRTLMEDQSPAQGIPRWVRAMELPEAQGGGSQPVDINPSSDRSKRAVPSWDTPAEA